MQRIKLRERGIYTLGDGRKFVLHRIGKNRYNLFSQQYEDGEIVAQYVLTDDGSIRSKGISTRWHIKDLFDTGRTYTVLQT
jgi:hypothetical protein